jgi:hypothetical protein
MSPILYSGPYDDHHSRNPAGKSGRLGPGASQARPKKIQARPDTSVMELLYQRPQKLTHWGIPKSPKV